MNDTQDHLDPTQEAALEVLLKANTEDLHERVKRFVNNKLHIVYASKSALILGFKQCLCDEL